MDRPPSTKSPKLVLLESSSAASLIPKACILTSLWAAVFLAAPSKGTVSDPPPPEWQIKGTLAALEDLDSRVRRAVAMERMIPILWGNIGKAAREQAPQVAALLEDADWNVREAAAIALGEMAPIGLSGVFSILHLAYIDPIKAPKFRLYAYFFSGGDQNVKILIAWLGNPNSYPSMIHSNGVRSLEFFEQAWEASADFDSLRLDMERRIAEICSHVKKWTPEDRSLLLRHAENLEETGSTHAPAVRIVASSLGRKK